MFPHTVSHAQTDSGVRCCGRTEKSRNCRLPCQPCVATREHSLVVAFLSVDISEQYSVWGLVWVHRLVWLPGQGKPLHPGCGQQSGGPGLGAQTRLPTPPGWHTSAPSAPKYLVSPERNTASRQNVPGFPPNKYRIITSFRLQFSCY